MHHIKPSRFEMQNTELEKTKTPKMMHVKIEELFEIYGTHEKREL